MQNNSFQMFVHKIVAQTQAQPDKVALVCAGKDVTYATLINHACVIADRIRSLDLPPQSAIGVFVPRGPEMVASMLGVVMAGHAYVPLDLTMPEDRIESMVMDAGIVAIIADQTPKTPQLVPHWVASSVSSDDMMIPEGWKIDDVTGEDLAYIMFTSGSTGRPKGVRIPHAAVSNFLESMAQRPGLVADDRLLAVTNPGFDISVLELFLPLTVGATIVLATDQERIDGQELAQLLRMHEVTVMQATPATWRILLAHGWSGEPGLKILCGGEPLDQSLAEQLLQRSASLWNMYGPTETTVWSSCGQIHGVDTPIDVGAAISKTDLAVLDEMQNPVADGDVGELYIAGQGLAAGYTDPALNADRFVTLQIGNSQGKKWYRTGDLARRISGKLIILGRADDQVKIDGHRIELDEVRGHLRQCEGVEEATVVAVQSQEGRAALAGVFRLSLSAEQDINDIRTKLTQKLPGYMVPEHLFSLQDIPLTPSGKVDHKSVRGWVENQLVSNAQPQVQDGETRTTLAQIIAKHTRGLMLDQDDNIFDAGITSLQANTIAADLTRKFKTPVSVAKIFEAPTIRQLEALFDDAPQSSATRADRTVASQNAEPIAIVGMAIRVPGADTLDEFWDVLKSGRETVTHFTKDEDDLVVSEKERNDPGYVRSRGMIKNPKDFDNKLFGVSPTDAMVMDPQQRVFLELAWEAMENAGYHSENSKDRIGVYAGMGNNFYFVHNIFPYPDLNDLVGDVQIEIGREKDHVATLVSHKLNFNGPSISLNTACSTGLVAIDQAWHSLRSGQCDMALAGAIELRTPQMSGQIAEPGGVFADDGHCRPFSDDSSGTMFSDGAGIVVMKRLSDAVADGDRIYSVIRGSAVNHDGRDKKSYLAPSIAGQVDVIKLAQSRAQITPDMVTYVEAHGTATPVGDPIEFEALLQAFGTESQIGDSCAIGSVKANLGHPTTAAGVVGVIKVALMQQNQTIPAQINFSQINRNIDIEQSPFFITTDTMPWDAGSNPRLAGISSFGFCGTNAHVVLQEAPAKVAVPAKDHVRPFALVVDSAATPVSLEMHQNRVSELLASQERPHIGSLAYSMAVGRKALANRSFCLINQSGETHKTAPIQTRIANAAPNRLAFMFPGQGAQYIGMGSDLFKSEPIFRNALEEVNAALMPHLGQSILDVMWATDDDASEVLNNTAFTQPAIFSISYALGRYFQEIGIQPDVMIGHSIGEISAATLAGVFSLHDAAKLIVARGRIMASLPPGSMLSIPISEQELLKVMPKELSLAAVNGVAACVVGGLDAEIDKFAKSMNDAGHATQKLRTSHAFHSWMMDAGLDAFRDVLSTIPLNSPNVPIISTVTGQVLSDSDACNVDYWVNHIRNPVRFADAVTELWTSKNTIALELGPRNVLTTLASKQMSDRTHQRAFFALGKSSADNGESLQITEAIGHLWANGISANWPRYFGAPEFAGRVTVPTYAFDRKTHWVDAPETSGNVRTAAPLPGLDNNIAGDGAADTADGDTSVLPQVFALLSSVSGETYADVPLSTSLTELGFDSLLLTPIAHLIKQTFGTKITFEELTTTVSTLDAICDRIQSEAQGSTDTPVATAPVEEKGNQAETETLGLTRMQTALYNQVLGIPDAADRCVDTASIWFKGPLDKAALRQAIGKLALRHTALRACLTQTGDCFVQTGLQDEHLIDAMYLHVAGQVDETADFYHDPKIDLNGGLLARFVLVGEGENHELILQAHRIIADGWSLDVLIEELGEIYSLERGQKSEPLHPADEPLHHVQREAQFLQSSDADVSELFWRRELDHADQDQMSDLPAKVTQSTTILDHTVLSELKAVAKKHDVSLFTCLLAGLNEVAPAVMDDGTVGVFVTSAGQPNANESRLVWQCTNLLPLHWTASPSCETQEILQVVQDRLMPLQEHKAFPVAVLSGGLRAKVQLTHVQRIQSSTDSFSGLEWDYQLNAPHYQSAALALQITEFNDRLVVCQTHRPDLISEADAQAALESYAATLGRMAHQSQATKIIQKTTTKMREQHV